jgi:subfamily B ATP-binding cassette protein MsbA
MGLVAASTAGNAWLMEPVLDRIFVARESHLLWAIAGVVLALAVVKGFATYGQSVLMNDVGQRIVADIQRSLFARLMRADLAFFHANPTGTLVSRFINDANLLRNAASTVLVGIGKDALTVVALVALMLWQDWLLALLSFVIFPIAVRPVIRIGRKMRRVSDNTQSELGQFTALLDHMMATASVD